MDISFLRVRSDSHPSAPQVLFYPCCSPNIKQG